MDDAGKWGRCEINQDELVTGGNEVERKNRKCYQSSTERKNGREG